MTGAGLLGVRAAGWSVAAAWREPIVGVLHVGHLWLVVGFACVGLAQLGIAFATSTATSALSGSRISSIPIGGGHPPG